jgi:hypothetical protein
MKQTRRKPGPKPVTPTSTDCRKVELGIAGGLSAASLARLFAMPVTTFKRAYAEQISTGRTRVLLDTLVALDREASAGSTAAAKGLLSFIERATKQDTDAEPDKWAGIADRIQAEMANSVDSKNWEN